MGRSYKYETSRVREGDFVKLKRGSVVYLVTGINQGVAYVLSTSSYRREHKILKSLVRIRPAKGYEIRDVKLKYKRTYS